ncbi:MAG: peptidylprolyl isomerase [Terracidiphilus sp.]
MQVEAHSRTPFRFLALALAAALALAGAAGCRRAVSPDVLATVNGKNIVRSDVEKIYKASIADMPQEPPAEEADLRRLSILGNLIDDEIIQQRAAKFSLVASDEDVNAKVTEMRALETQEDFEKHLKEKGVTIDEFRREWRRNLTRTRLLNKEIESKINVTDAEIEAFYNAHKPDFNVIEPRYNIAQILVTTEGAQKGANLQNNKANGEADAKKKIEALHTKLESGEDFAALAQSFSEDPNSASNGGDVGSVLESQLRLSPDVYNAIAKLKPGQITEVIPRVEMNGSARRVGGYAIYKLISREAAGQRTLNDPNVRQFIHRQLHEARYQLLRSAYLEMVRNEAQVHNYFADQILKNGAH